MNSKQRAKNRGTARELQATVRYMEDMKHVCPECGQPGRHWISWPLTLQHVVDKKDPGGFYRCQVKQ